MLNRAYNIVSGNIRHLGMSRTPVREALVRLENEGWVRLVPRHGFVVTPLVADDLQQLYEIVEELEGAAVALTTVRSRADGLEEFDDDVGAARGRMGRAPAFRRVVKVSI